MEGYNKKIGELGEKKAAGYLWRRGYKILERNFRTRSGEIDIIASDPKGVLVFAEVKTRTGDKMGSPSDAVDLRKRRHLITAANIYISAKKMYERDARFDVIEVYIKNGFPVPLYKINHIKDAFE